MLHNSGPYGPNDVPINMGIPVNMTQMSNPMNLGHNLGNLPKMPQQAPEAEAPVYDIPDYRSFGHSPLNMGHPMSPFPNYHQMNFQTNYVHPNPNLPHNTTPSNFENNILPMNLNTHSDHGPSLMNYHNPESKKFDINNLHYRENLSRKVPINIPQIHTKAFQKHLGMESNHDQYNTVQENQFYSHNSTKVPEKSLIDTNRRKSLENTVKLIEDILINSTPKDKLKNVNTDILNNTLNKSSLDMRNTKLHGIDNSKELQTTINLSHKISTDDSNPNTDLLRARLEVKDTKSDIHGLNLTSKSCPNKSIDLNTKLQKEDHAKTKKTVINELPDDLSKTNSEKELPIQSEIHCKPLRRSLMNNQTEKGERRRESNGSDSEKEDIIAEVDIKKEIIEEDIVEIKVELVECSGSESSPFLKDSNATPRDVLDADAVIVEDNNVAEAKEAAKKGSNPKTYFECTHCGLLFRHPKRFLVHTKWHTFGLTSETRHRMEKERELKKSMKREARIIERLNAKEVKDGAEGDVHPCKDCDKVFSVKSSLKNHRQKYHPTRVRECKICKASVTGWMALRAHMAAHAAGSAPGYACADCPKRFKYAHSLAKHRDTHLEKTLSCEQCSKKFGSQALLKMHMKCHERAARGATHRCTYCGKGFFESYNLQVHERTHRNERPFTCDICKTSFGTNSSLKRHLKVSHSTSKPYTCETCHRSFASSTTRARHTARAHGDSSAFPHKCTLCPRQYSAQKELQKHIGKTHREERDRGEIG
ncbi:zinc finger and SCAN domain-containing protein 26-like [Cydia strobilella]|uniref:zinc finger and SCAN domain-containing protein 26-like n=1 Tax=Cydia strobilella TaxID=1100964 RepID=UPI003004EAC3